jgi:hypothetical protein
MAFRIDPQTLYSRADLERELAGLVEVETFLGKLRPRAVFRGCYLGADILTALKATHTGEQERPKAHSRVILGGAGYLKEMARCG